MNFPFDFNLSGDKIDLSRDADRNLVIERNKKLNEAVENGIEPENLVKAQIEVKLNFECFKCGSTVEMMKLYDTDVMYGLDLDFSFVTCKCGTKYIYDEQQTMFWLETKSNLKKDVV